MRLALICSATLTLLLAGTASADVFDTLEAVVEAELEEARGGFVMDGGSVVGLGVEVRTLVDGQLALETLISVGPSGLVVTERAAPGLTPAASADLQAAAQRGLSLQGLAGQRVFIVAEGTAVTHRISGDSLQNLIVNAGDGLDLKQTIDVRMVLDADALAVDQASLAGLRAGLAQADLVRAGVPF